MGRTRLWALSALALVGTLFLSKTAMPLGRRPDPEGSAALKRANWLLCDFGGSASQNQNTQSEVFWSDEKHRFEFALTRKEGPPDRAVIILDDKRKAALLFELVRNNHLNLPNSQTTHVRFELRPWLSMLITAHFEDNDSFNMTMLVSHIRAANGHFISFLQIMSTGGWLSPAAITRVGECTAQAERSLELEIEGKRRQWLLERTPADRQSSDHPTDAKK